MRVVALLASSLVAFAANAQTPAEALIKQSQLTISAFNCSLLAKDPKKEQELFNLGQKTGRSFLATWRADPDLRQQVTFKVARAWLRPGMDDQGDEFVLGRVYQQLYADFERMYPARVKVVVA